MTRRHQRLPNQVLSEKSYSSCLLRNVFFFIIVKRKNEYGWSSHRGCSQQTQQT